MKPSRSFLCHSLWLHASTEEFSDLTGEASQEQGEMDINFTRGQRLIRNSQPTLSATQRAKAMELDLNN